MRYGSTRVCWLLLAFWLLALGGCSDSNDDDSVMQPAPPPPPPANTMDLDLALSADQVVGGGAMAGSATAEVTVNLDDGSLSGTVTLTGLTADGVTVNRGFAGDTGPVLITLEQESSTQWRLPDSVTLSADELSALNDGGLYVLVTSAAQADGALRGQLVPDGIRVLFTPLSGLQQVPPLTTSATGRAALTLDTDSGDITLHANTSGLDDAVQAHIHEALAGVNGGVLVGLSQDPDDPGHWLVENFTFDQAALDALAAGALYVNVHSPAHPGGEIRGQLEPEGVDVFFTRLSGDAVVPPVTTDASGVAAATLDVAARVLTLHVNLLEADDAATVTVNQAPMMQNGPAVLMLEQDANDVAHWRIEGVMLTDAQNEALRNQGLYVSVATPAAPDGELRGQLVPDMSTAGTGDAFLVESISPDDGATVAALPQSVVATFNRDVLAGSAGPAQVSVAASGGDGSFGDGNELAVDVLSVAAAGSQLTAELDVNAAADDVYRILLDGSSANPLTDRNGVVLDGDADGAPGGDFIATFTVDATSSAPTLSLLQTNIFTPSCAKSGCHAGPSPQEGMNLSAGQTFANVVDVPSNQVPSLDRVEPGDPEASYLVRKVEGTAAGLRMPADGPPFLTDAQIQDIRDWISAGAQDN